jgi:urease accessory protein
MLGEALLPGRVAYGEEHLHDLYRAETKVRNADDRLLVADVLGSSRPTTQASSQPTSSALMTSSPRCTTISGLAGPTTLVAMLRSALATCSDLLAGVTGCPMTVVPSFECSGPAPRRVQAALRRTWSEARHGVVGRTGTHLRKGWSSAARRDGADQLRQQAE